MGGHEGRLRTLPLLEPLDGVVEGRDGIVSLISLHTCKLCARLVADAMAARFVGTWED